MDHPAALKRATLRRYGSPLGRGFPGGFLRLAVLRRPEPALFCVIERLCVTPLECPLAVPLLSATGSLFYGALRCATSSTELFTVRPLGPHVRSGDSNLLALDSAAGPLSYCLAGGAFGHPRPGAVVILKGGCRIELESHHASFLAGLLLGMTGCGSSLLTSFSPFLSPCSAALICPICACICRTSRKE